MNPTQFTSLMTELERDYHLLSADRLDQESLFDIQETILSKMVDIANTYPTIGAHLARQLPYLFTATPKEATR